jgi:hypothetical protein
VYNTPSEFSVGGVYMPPLLVAASLGFVAALLTVRALNHYRLSRYFFYPPLVFIGLVAIYTLLVGSVVIPF